MKKFGPSPVWTHDKLSIDLGVDLKVKRDDLLPFMGGGNKVRKMASILEEAQRQGADAIVTAGGPNSNHVRVFAIACAQLGWHLSAVIHSDAPLQEAGNLNLQITTLTGADIIHCCLSDAPNVMDREMERLRETGYSPYYVWGGGHTVEGVGAYVEAVSELRIQLEEWRPDYIIVASGTGGTQAGLHIGVSAYLADTEVIGVSVARNQKRGVAKLAETIDEYCQESGAVSRNEVIFFDDYNAGGYERINESISIVVEEGMRKYGLGLDPVYTGKAFWGLKDLISKNYVEEGSKVVFWHTGGLFNLFPISKLH